MKIGILQLTICLLQLTIYTPCLSEGTSAPPTIVDRSRIETTIRELAGYGSRVTGYEGAERAADWIRGELRKAGVKNIYERTFPLPVPMDEGAALSDSTGDVSIPIFPLWPNLARTSTLQGVEGVLVDGGDGTYYDLNGKDVKGQIILLNYNSGMAWLNAFTLGAAAVLFLEPASTHRHESESKFLTAPADLPRFYAPRQEETQLRGMIGRRVRLTARQSWHNVQGKTIIGIIEGTDHELRQEAVIIETYYDAISPVPSLAPGAEAASGTAGLLELAHLLTTHPPKRSVIVIATAGHFEGLAGIRDLVYFFQQQPEHLKRYHISLFIGLDLSSQSDHLGVYQAGSPYRTRTITPPIRETIFRLTRAYEENVLGGERILADGLKRTEERVDMGGTAMTIPFDGAAFQLAGGLALTFCTINDDRRFFDTPLDRPEVVNFDHLTRQIDFLASVIPALIDVPDMPVQKEGKKSFGVLRGKVVRFGTRSAFPDSAVGGALVRARLREKVLAGVRVDFMTMTDTKGRFEIPGMESGVLYAQPTRIEAYGIDPATGEITDAPDLGVNGEGRSPTAILMEPFLEKEMTIITFPCRAMTLFDLVDPRYLTTLDHIQVLEAGREAEPLNYGVCLPLRPSEAELFGYTSHLDSYVEPCAVIFPTPGGRTKVTMATGRYGIGKRLILLNSKPGIPEGEGFNGEGMTGIPMTSYRTAIDMTTLNGDRLSLLRRHGVENHRLLDLQRRSETAVEEALQALYRKDYDRFMDKARQGWGFASRAYHDIRGTVGDVIVGAVAILILLLPFSLFCERLFLACKDIKRRTAATFGIFLGAFFVVRTIHPAFALTNFSSITILLGFTILFLSTLVTYIVLTRLNRQLQELTSHRIQRVDVRRIGMLITAVGVGIAHLRRRPFRTGLTCTTIVLVTFSALSFTSIRFFLSINQVPIGDGAVYDGFLIRMPGWRAIDIGVLDQFIDRYGEDHITPRIWKTAVQGMRVENRERAGDKGTGGQGDRGTRGQGDKETGRQGDRGTGGQRRAIVLDQMLGLAPSERFFTHPEKTLIAGEWFGKRDDFVCLLPQGIASELGITPDQSVRLFGESLRVRGIFDEKAFKAIRDLNGEPLTPLDPEAQQPAETVRVGTTSGGRTAVYTHAEAERMIIVPYRTALLWEGAAIRSIGIRMERGEWKKAELDDFTTLIGLNVTAGIGGNRYLVNAVDRASLTGERSLMVPIIIAALIIFNTMLGSVYERRREIATFNAVGLSPGHIIGLFITEATVYGVLGGIFGYLAGQTAAILILHWNLLGGLTLNYSSLSTIWTMMVVMVTVILSSLYPAAMSRRLSVPGIERRWTLPPGEDGRISMELPFTFQEGEIDSFMAFLISYFKQYEESSIGGGFLMISVTTYSQREASILTTDLSLAPFDQGVTEECRITIAPEEEIEGIFRASIDLARKTGDTTAWRRGNQFLINELRKQFLLWKATKRWNVGTLKALQVTG